MSATVNGAGGAAPSLPATVGSGSELGLGLDGLPDAVLASTRDERIVFANALAGDMFGYSPDDLLGRPLQTLWPERVRQRYSQNLRLYFATEHPLRFSDVAYGLRSDGSEFLGEMSWGIVHSAVGAVLLVIGRDISDQRRRSRQTASVGALAERALAGADVRDLAAQALAAMRATLCLERVEVRRLDPPEVLASWGEPTGPRTCSVPIASTGEPFGAIEFAPALGDDDEAFVRATAKILGTAAGRLRDDEQIRHNALHDALTGLANRSLLDDRLEHALAQRNATTAVLFIDLDAFKQVNDTHGHHAGDEALVELARRLRALVRPADTIARIGGDEFVIVCEDIDEPAARSLSARLQAGLQAPLTFAGITQPLTASVGLALVSGRTSTPELALADADAAAYRAKAAGGARITIAHG
jgi:diguanylate cyclase (GGDEF)-like protein/PAS domain S-box-containing protein